ncbi:MAG: Hsp20/alpha crystallin family protein [Gammaproteobacteria bacterium]|jgi:HSP20 family protein|nr:Hsp20/alpha crystallin family protein [Gammaproteobacteria bacterium]MDX2458541.1 Hsp20/alpha crystallin family protein [Gammaproteobacteria bacterium]
MNVVRYEPWGLLRRFNEDVNQLFNESRIASTADGDQSSIATSNWTPAVDIKEEDGRFVLKADIPGVEVKDIDVTMDDGVLTIKGERRHESEEDANGYKRVERSYGSFYRRFGLPDTANAEGITAKGKDGVLEVSIPKQEKAQPRKITVS